MGGVVVVFKRLHAPRNQKWRRGRNLDWDLLGRKLCGGRSARGCAKGASIGERIYFRNLGSPTDDHRRGDAGSDNRPKGRCVSDVANLARRGAFGILVVVP